MDFLIVAILGPPVWLLFGYAGRWCQYRLNQMHRPYVERAKS